MLVFLFGLKALLLFILYLAFDSKLFGMSPFLFLEILVKYAYLHFLMTFVLCVLLNFLFLLTFCLISFPVHRILFPYLFIYLLNLVITQFLFSALNYLLPIISFSFDHYCSFLNATVFLVHLFLV
jgi:hypothetical protein